MAEVLVVGKKISEMDLVTDIVGDEKIPTGVVGDKAVTTGQLLTYLDNNGKVQWGRIEGDISNQTDLQNQFSQQLATLQNHIQDQGNPHNVTKEQVGLGLADNTADMDKPVSTAVQEALSLKADLTYVDDSLANKTHNSLLGRDADGAHPASAIKDASGVSQQVINDALLRDTYYALNEGFKTDGSANDAAWNALQAKLKVGDTVIFNAGTYTFSGNMNIEKIINIVGQGRIRGVKAILKFNSGGVVRKTAGIDIRDINIAGAQTTTVLDFDNRIFGNIGLKEQYDGVSDTSTCRLSSVTITGFDVGRVTAQEGSATWAGAYRDNTDVVIQRNRVGYVALDGATHEKYVGGTISANTEIGVWAEAKNHNYNNIDFIGTTLEINGHEGNNYNTRDVLKSLNVFAGANTIINFIGSYNERVVSIAKDGGIINKIGSYEHPNSYNFSSDGNINLVLSNSSHVSKLDMQNSLANLTAFLSGGLSVVGVSDNHIRVTTSSQSLASFRSKEFKVTGIKNSEIRFIKLSFRYKFTGGFTANTQLNVQPMFFLRSTDGTTDTTTTNLAYPKQLLINSYNEWHTFEFFYRPRIVDGYLTPDDFLNSFDFRFLFYNGLDSIPNFTTDQLVCDLSNVEVEIFGSKQARLDLGYKTSGVTADRPVLLSTEKGVQFYNTSTDKIEMWDGTQWVVLNEDQAASMPAVVSTSTGVLGNATANINTLNKTAGGRLVFATNNGKMYYPLGSTPTSAWRPTDNSGDITPA